jgi:S-adenosylmethionine-diacylglycerol 3-amino-3-carboxypropyl transferase
MEARVKFAVVREDPRLETALIKQRDVRSALVVASGGCTALTIGALHPDVQLTAFDINRFQLEHVAKKHKAAIAGDLAALNVEDSNPSALNQLGAFEGLFRVLKHAIAELVAPEHELVSFFSLAGEERRALVERWMRSRYWPAAYATAFNDSLLHAMFGPEATQHAEPGSYPGYFQRVFERGLLQEDAQHNPFLQHVLIGAYRITDAPPYVLNPPAKLPELILGSLFDVESLERFDLYSLSNVFDWSNDRQIASWAAAILEKSRIGSTILIRQLNNQRDVRRFFEPAFEFDSALGAQLLEQDRSLFYERIEVAFRVQ